MAMGTTPPPAHAEPVDVQLRAQWPLIELESPEEPAAEGRDLGGGIEKR